MKLVGASDTYVKSPFVSYGIFFGVVSGFISGLVILIISFFISHFNFIPAKYEFGFFVNLYVSPVVFSLFLWIILMISGYFLGRFGSSRAINRYLKF